MKLFALSLIASCAAKPNVQFVGVETDKEYTISCTDTAAEFPQGDSSVTVTKCLNSNCPELEVELDGTIRITNFPVLSSGSEYQCSNGQQQYDLMIGVLEPATPDVSGGSTEFKSASTGPTELAKCSTGYAQPGPIVVWKDENGKEIISCNSKNADNIDTNVCFRDVADEANPNRVGADLTLVADVSGEGHFYYCEVISWKAENGEQVEVTSSVRYPESGCITVEGGSCPGDDETTIRPVTMVAAEEPEISTVEFRKQGEEEVPVSEAPEEHTDEEVEEEEEDDTFHNALLGTATGIVIFAIIVILIWFIRKKRQDEEETQYTEGEVQLKAEEEQQTA